MATKVQSNSSTATTTVALTGVAAGNLIVLLAQWEGNSANVTVSDGTTSLTVGTRADGPTLNNVSSQFAYLLSANSGNKTYTVTFPAGTVAGTQNIIVIEFNATGAWSFDTQNTGSGTSTTGSTSNITTAGTDEVVCGGTGINSSSQEPIATFKINAVAADGSVTASNSGNPDAAMWYRLLTATFAGGNATCAYAGVADEFSANVIAFKAATTSVADGRDSSIPARPGGSMGPRMRRALPQRYPDSPVTPVELTQTPAAPIPAISLGPRRRRSIPQQYADTPVIPVELTQSPAAPFRPGRGPGMGPMLLRRNLAWPLPGIPTASPDVTLALTGVQGTVSLGTLGVQLDVAMTGNAATVSVGTLTPNTDVALTGVSGTGSVGTLAPSTTVAMTGVVGTGSVGTLAPTNTVTLSGNEATVMIGTLTPNVAGDVTIALTGVSASVLIGDLAASGGDVAGGAASTGGAKRKIRGPYSDPRVYEAYIKRCIAEREAEKKRPLEVSQLKDALVDVVEERWQTEYDERDALLKENQIIERLITLEKSKRDVRAMIAKQQQIARALADIEDEEELIFAAIHFIEDDYAY